MACLYRLKSGTVWEPTIYVEAGITLIDFLGSGFGKAVEGAVFLRKDTQEWWEYLDTQRKILETRKDYPVTPENAQRFIDGLSRSEFLLAKSTNLRGVAYERAGINKRALFDESVPTTAILSYPSKQIEVYKGSFGDVNILGDQFLKQIERLYYDGTFEDALEEFKANGFVLVQK